MAKATPTYSIEIEQQGISMRDLPRQGVLEFVRQEQAFYNEMEPLLNEQVVLFNTNAGASGVYNASQRAFSTIAKSIEKDNCESLDAYVAAARSLEVVIGQGSIGRNVASLLKAGDKELAKFTLLLFSSRWLEKATKNSLAPLRAAVLGSPAVQGASHIMVAQHAEEIAVATRDSIEVAKANLDRFTEAKTKLLDELEQLYRDKLVLEKPAAFWRKVQDSKRKAWRIWLGAFGVLAVAPIVLAILYSDKLVEFVAHITASGNGGISLGGVAAITVPALFYAWLLKNISRLFVQSLTLAEDAAHRRALALTYLGLSKNPKLSISEQERALVLNALFRPLPSHGGDEGPPNGLLELLRGKAGAGG